MYYDGDGAVFYEGILKTITYLIVSFTENIWSNKYNNLKLQK